MFKVQCPKCKNRMYYQPKPGPISKKVKKCVYCGHSFMVHTGLKTDRIVKRL